MSANVLRAGAADVVDDDVDAAELLDGRRRRPPLRRPAS